MNRLFYLSAFFTSLLFIATSCGGPSAANKTGDTSSPNPNTAAHPPINTGTPGVETFNNAPTLNPVVQQFYEALKNKDDAKLRETMTTEYQKHVEEDMKQEKRKDFAAFVAETD